MIRKLSTRQRRFKVEHKLSPIETLLYINEGYRSKPYRCTANKLTIGIGYNLDDNNFPESAAVELLRYTLSGIHYHLRETYDFYNTAPENIKIAMQDLVFNLGASRFAKFKNTIKHLELQEYDLASKELLDSKYAKQLKNRSKLISEIIKNKKPLNQILKGL
jgi:lysozyme